MNSPKELVKQNSFDIVRDNGNHLIENNEFFKDLSDIMEDDKFSNFFKKIFLQFIRIKNYYYLHDLI